MNRWAKFVGSILLCGVPAVLVSAQAPYPPPVQAFATIVHQPPQESSFTLDRSMLAAADGFLNGTDPYGRTVAAGLNSITFTNFHFREYASYDPGALGSLSAAYESAGYHHLVNASGNGAGSAVDMWLRTQGAMVTSVVVLQRGDRNMSAINVDCNLRPLDLLHLSGHFGLPKVDASAVMVPAPPPGSVPSVATGPITPAPSVAPAPALKHHGTDDSQ